MVDAAILIADKAIDYSWHYLPDKLALVASVFISIWRVKHQLYLEREIVALKKERHNPMSTIIQVPAKKSHWGLFSFPYGVPGRLGFKPDKIVIHWMDGNIDTADRVFKGETEKERMVSAHFGVQDDVIHQYVSVNDVAWHAGVWSVNLRSIGIEISAQPEHGSIPARDASDASYVTVGQLVRQVCDQFPTIKFARESLHPHNEYKNTACPGTVNLDRIFQEAANVHQDIQYTNNPIPATLASSGSSITFAPFNTDLSPSQTVRDEVKRVQDYLIALKLMTEPAPANKGKYGPKTQSAVDTFQKNNGIPKASEFGWWYKKTRAAANNKLTIQR